MKMVFAIASIAILPALFVAAFAFAEHRYRGECFFVGPPSAGQGVTIEERRRQ